MFTAAKMLMASGVLVATLVGGTAAQAATTPAPTNNMTQGNSGGMMGDGSGMMGHHTKSGTKTNEDMMGMMAMMTSCTTGMTAEINMMNAMTNELNAQTALLTREAAASSGTTPK
jgi:hypothetical protein